MSKLDDLLKVKKPIEYEEEEEYYDEQEEEEEEEEEEELVEENPVANFTPIEEIKKEVDEVINNKEKRQEEKKSYKEKVKERIGEEKKRYKKKIRIRKKNKPDKPVEKEPVYNSKENVFTSKDRYEAKKKFSIGKDRKERKRIMGGENAGVFDRQKFYLAIFSISLFMVFLLYSYAPQNEAVMAIVILLGASLFLPIGMIFGWMVLDPFMRCKIARKVSRKNYGIINFVAKGKKIISKMKNFDEDLVWIKNKCWAITKEGIYEIDKTGERINDGEVIDPDGVLTITETVPIMFIDMVSMQPLAFKGDQREGIAPEELGSTLKGWVDNQMAKVMFLKKTLDMYFVIVILSCIASAYLSYDNMTKLEKITEEIEIIKNMIGGLNIP